MTLALDPQNSICHFVGPMLDTHLDPLPLEDCSQFWPKNISPYEKLKVLSVTGGIPKYLEEINPKFSAEENIRRLCFTRGGLLVEEFEQIFSDLFLRQSVFYKKIIEVLASKSKERDEICKVLGLQPGGRITEYLEELELAGFITRDYIWDIEKITDSKLSKYRLSDNYLRFYLNFIQKNLNKINRNAFQLKSLASLPEWNTIMGLQFENLVFSNRMKIHEALKIRAEEIVSENPFYQRKTKRLKGCQIDYMIQTRFNTLYICEIKFSKNEVDASVIQDIQRKMDALKYPKGFSCRPVLIHVNGVAQSLLESDFFTSIIDFSKFL